MKILIVGTDFNSSLLAQYIKMQDTEHDVYLTTQNNIKSQHYTAKNNNENDIQSICDFVKYNQIEFTIVTSPLAIINGIADLFKKEGFPIFAPFAESARITFFNSIAKKIMYKLKINTPKFGIFDRENLATDYIRHSRLPVVIANDFTLLSRENNVYRTFGSAKEGLQKIFESGNEKIVIENYIDSEPLYVYFITDGYNALPLITLDRVSGDGYTTISSPCKKISDSMIISILRNAIYPLLDDITKYAGNYTGIIGLKIKILRNNFYILEFYNGFQYYDFQAFLSLLNENLLELLHNSANGNLGNTHDYISLTDEYSYTIAVRKDQINSDDDNSDFIESEDEHKHVYTCTASTLNHARQELSEYIKTICDSDLYNKIEKTSKLKEIKI